MSELPQAILSNKRTLWGTGMTAAYILWLVVLAIWKRDAILDLKPNEFGDALVGVAGPVAFLWLILGYLQQGEELRHSAHALKLQADELKASVEQQKELVEATREQIADDRREREGRERELDRQSLPVFEITNSAFRRDDEYLQALVIRNTGPRCTFLTFAIDDFHKSGIGEMAAGGKDTIHWSPVGSSSSHMLTIHFIDSKGRPGFLRTELVLMGGGHVPHFRVVPGEIEIGAFMPPQKVHGAGSSTP